MAGVIIATLLMPSLPLGRTKSRAQRVNSVNTVARVTFTLPNTNALPGTTREVLVLRHGVQARGPAPRHIYGPLLIESNVVPNNVLTNK